jgi:hypothetical protein
MKIISRNSLVMYLAALLNLIYFSSCNEASSAEQASQKQSAAPASFHSPKKIAPPPTEVDNKKSSRVCPVCGAKKKPSEELCRSCYDEVANTCYRCGKRQQNLNGKLCSKCSPHICAICNRRKESKDDDLCVKCHNAIEVRNQKRK